MEITGKYPGALNILKCIGLRDEESVLILIDEFSQKDAIRILENALRSKCSRVTVCILPKYIQPDFPSEICQRIKEYEVIILAASQSWYQVPARREAKYEYRKRVIECYGLTTEMLNSGALCGNYEVINHCIENLRTFFKVGASVEINKKNGTNFTAKIRNIYEETGNYVSPGSGGNLPAGEISLGIDENTAHGKLIFDISFDILGRLENSPLIVVVERGKVVDVQGVFKKTFATVLDRDNCLRNIAEVGIGANEYAVLGRSVLEDEKKLGTVHVGFGNDTYFGGKVDGPHIDGVVSNATVFVDGELLMLDGLLIKR